MTALRDLATDADERRTGLGGSDISSIAGMNDYRTPRDTFDFLVGNVEMSEGGEAALWGNILQQPVIEETARRLGVRIARVNRTLRHRAHPFLMGHVDGRVVGPHRDGRWGVEVKTTNVFTAKNDWGETAEDLPPHVQLQVQHYCEVGEFDGFYVPVLIGGQKLKIFEVERDREMGEKIVRLGVNFWLNHVVPKIPPPISTYEEASSIFPQHRESAIAASEEIATSVALFAMLKKREKELAAEIDAEQAKLAAFLGENDTLTVFGDPVLTWRTQSSSRFDAKQFKIDNPELHAQYVRASTSRVMRLKCSAK
jgi:putative phage-type endonuclease